jgi:hypothetical protein
VKNEKNFCRHIFFNGSSVDRVSSVRDNKEGSAGDGGPELLKSEKS